eukprot:2108928-Pyramimonas_sp.AAC.1
MQQRRQTECLGPFSRFILLVPTPFFFWTRRQSTVPPEMLIGVSTSTQNRTGARAFEAACLHSGQSYFTRPPLSSLIATQTEIAPYSYDCLRHRPTTPAS